MGIDTHSVPWNRTVPTTVVHKNRIILSSSALLQPLPPTEMRVVWLCRVHTAYSRPGPSRPIYSPRVLPFLSWLLWDSRESFVVQMLAQDAPRASYRRRKGRNSTAWILSAHSFRVLVQGNGKPRLHGPSEKDWFMVGDAYCSQPPLGGPVVPKIMNPTYRARVPYQIWSFWLHGFHWYLGFYLWWK